MRRLFAPQDRLRLTNEDAVNALAFAPPRGAWSVEAHAHFPPALRKRCAKLLLLKPAHVPNVCWLRVLSYALDAREAEPLLASAAGNGVQLWRGGAPAGRLRGHASIVRAVAFSARGDALATAALDETVRVWRRVDPARRRAERKIRSDVVSPRRSRSAGPPQRRSCMRSTSPAVSDASGGVSDGELPCRFRSGSFGEQQRGACVVCGVRDNEPAVALPCCGQRCHRACLERWLASAPDAPLPSKPRAQRSVAFDDDDAEPTWTCNSVLRHGCDVLSVALSDAFCVSGARDGGVRIWAPHDDERLVHSLRAPVNDETNEQWGAVRCLAFSGNRERVWAGSDDGYVRQFVVSTGELMLRFRAHASRLYDVAFSPELNLLASCGQDQLLKLWRGDVEIDAARHDAWVHGVAFGPGGRLVATAGADLTVNVFHVTEGGAFGFHSELKRHEGAVTCLAFAPAEAGGGLASGSVDGTIALWRRLQEDTDATDSDA